MKSPWASPNDPRISEPALGQSTFLDEVEATKTEEEAREIAHEWIGLPAFREDSKTSRLVVQFDSDDDRRAFMKELGLETVVKGTRGTLSVRYPDRGREDLSSLRFVITEVS